MKIAFDVHARQPNVQLVKHDAVGQVHRTKEFRLGEFKEANVGAVKNNARRVNVAPAHSLFNRICLMVSQVKKCETECQGARFDKLKEALIKCLRRLASE